MKQKFRLGVLGVLLTCSAPTLADGRFFLSASVGKFDHDPTQVIINAAGDATDPTSITLNNEESDLISIGWGVADENARFLFEYYYQNTDLSVSATEYTKHGLYYSGYWTPNLYVPKLHGILGAGIGATELQLDSDESLADDFKDREVQYKLTAGIEYRLTDWLTLFGTYEQHYARTYSHWNEQRVVDVKDGDQSILQFGIAAQF